MTSPGEGLREARCFVISITPFTADGRVDEPGLRAHLRRLAGAGVGVYVGGGGSGEGYTLTAGEVRQVQEAAAAELGGRAPVRAMGVEPRTAREMSEFVSLAGQAGMDAVQIYSLDVGHGHQPTPGELEAYFAEVLDAADLPCVISSHQSVGYRVPVPLLASLAERYPHLTGVNCSQPDLTYLAHLVDELGDRLTVHVGGPMQALTAWALGADGFLCSEGNLVPGLCARLTAAYDRGDTQEMMASFGTLLRLSQLLYGNGGIRATKAVLDALGLPGGPPRAPRLPVDEDGTAALLASLESLGVVKGTSLLC